MPGPGPWLRLLVRHEEDATKPIAGTCWRGGRPSGRPGWKVPKPTTAPPSRWWRRSSPCSTCWSAPGGKAGWSPATAPATAAATLAAATGLGPGLLGFTVHPEVGQGGLELAGQPVADPAARCPGPRLRPDLLLVLDGTPAAAVRAALARHCRWEGRLALPLPGLIIA